MTYEQALDRARREARKAGSVHFAAATVANATGQGWYDRLSRDLSREGFGPEFDSHPEEGLD